MGIRFKGKNSRKKYGGEKVDLDGYQFPSKLEASVYLKLKEQVRIGEIRIEKVQDAVYLGPARFRYTPDFKCYDLHTKEYFWAEAKGFETTTWRRNKRLWKIHGPGKLLIYMGSYHSPFLKEVVTPKAGVCKECGRAL